MENGKVTLFLERVAVRAAGGFEVGEQIENFLTNAKVVSSKPAGKGVTGSWRLTLSDGTTTHDASS